MVAAIKRKSQSFDGVRGCQPARQFFVVEADQTQVEALLMEGRQFHRARTAPAGVQRRLRLRTQK